jgi:hypothetical protein
MAGQQLPEVVRYGRLLSAELVSNSGNSLLTIMGEQLKYTNSLFI